MGRYRRGWAGIGLLGWDGVGNGDSARNIDGIIAMKYCDCYGHKERRVGKTVTRGHNFVSKNIGHNVHMGFVVRVDLNLAGRP